MQNFRTYQLALQFHKECRSLRVKGAIRDQLERALLSIPLNLAEGSAKPTAKDRKRFYYIALGSLREVQTILSLMGSDTQMKMADILGAHLYKLCRAT